jgi:hypothetical protein
MWALCLIEASMAAKKGQSWAIRKPKQSLNAKPKGKAGNLLQSQTLALFVKRSVKWSAMAPKLFVLSAFFEVPTQQGL